jgi:hypothetical protein
MSSRCEADADPGRVFDFAKWRPRDDAAHGRKPAEGLGDAVAAAIHAVTGIRPCARCERRRRWLNEKFPFGRKKTDG